MKKLLKTLSIPLVSLSLFLQVFSASASVITFDYTDTVTVGDSFTVNVMADLGANDLLGFGFDLASLTNNTSFVSGTIHSAFADDFINDVGGSLVDIFDAVNGNVQLAELTFSADNVGTDTISLFGDSSNFEGLVFWNMFYDTSIDVSFDIKIIDAVKDVPSPAALSLLALGLLALVHLRKQS
ncbi:hypothetical protein RS130_10885 [Paraglaciecola aquimarina]|uniref:PEP-CTERM protein-sorting domain-containing protein n=1 Tax=Paraglaciecola aquimarina TaxID=1235557 RepID=A0ABU3SWH7_9ALTE|nr:hypothetical protein [Paraglaciecola aquimarina]MDU0354370.1 hypothetical protein [Paraglaciecola aquimarina]